MLFSISLVLFLILTIFLPNTFAQEISYTTLEVDQYYSHTTLEVDQYSHTTLPGHGGGSSV